MIPWKTGRNETQVAAMPQMSLLHRPQRSTNSLTENDDYATTQVAANANTAKNIPIELIKIDEVPVITPRRMSMNLESLHVPHHERTRSHSSGRHANRLSRAEVSQRLIFQAMKITKGDYWLRGYEDIQVLVDTIRRQLIITVDKRKVVDGNGEDIYDSDDSEDANDPPAEASGNRLLIKWDDISGLDFQHQPLGPSIVVFELRNPPLEAPKHFHSNFYFLYCSKEDCERYLDRVMLSNDTRLYKLAIQSLPSWAVIVNRYSLPFYYSHNFRTIITTLVNIYIVISLIWGFYDLYKNLPIVGGALRRIVGPIVGYFEPLLHNRVVLLIPLLFTRLYAIYTNLVSPIASNLFYPILQFFGHMVYPIIQSFGSFGGKFYSLISPITSGIVLLATSFGQLFSAFYYGLYALIKVPFELLVFFKNLAAGQLTLLFGVLGSLFGGVFTFIKLLWAPISKIKSLFSLRQPVVEAVQATATTANHVSQIKAQYDTIKENYLNPASSLWAGFRRIIDSIIHTYHTKIKHHDVLLRRLLITFLCLTVLVALVIVICLIV